MKKRLIVIVLDGFGIGAMEDARLARPGDENANTLRSILKDYPDLKLPALEKLGLMNAYGEESDFMKFSPEANFGSCGLMHFGADTFMGHQEIMGTLPKKPEVHPFQEKAEAVKKHLEANGHQVQFIQRQGLRYLLVDRFVTVADNLEADLGMCYNVTAPLDLISFEEEYAIAKKVREVVTVGRVIVFGGTGNTMEDLWNAEEVKQDRFIGIASAKSKSYEQGYQCRHLGYGVDQKVQAPTILTKAGFDCTLIGKVADIVSNEGGRSISCVPTQEVMDLTLQETKALNHGFLCTNVQETDLAGHSQSTFAYKRILEIADQGVSRLLPELTSQDILVIMADHGNDPNIGHSKHTRERVPLLVYKKGIQGKCLGQRNTLSDIGATVCDYFGTGAPENGESFLPFLKD
ncbi:phosphopentomutase [Lacrimispora saccharolytica]|uniref:Phosphopentomutase n=1 Tax=Lacrimispora saccharolytica (strain ATCC 35040 / DSM 2544 / NRCC 2533 / WM1) TaxID=610130 RepID=D9R151_LACSW|nr:phosphopentomutase [Lacrimispora saccharolytica]ADL04598.1 Phosphopentomutase [[Clostridium] saccharolyticum WM1]QRV21160.1 phosphopentomutase [Lacrimispora saccharolytica]